MGDINLVNAEWELIERVEEGKLSGTIEVEGDKIRVTQHEKDQPATIIISNGMAEQTITLKVSESYDTKTYSLHHQSNREIF